MRPCAGSGTGESKSKFIQSVPCPILPVLFCRCDANLKRFDIERYMNKSSKTIELKLIMKI